MTLFRWKALIPFTIIAVLCGIGGFYFAEPLIKLALIKSGQAAFKAKVEIDEVKLSFFPLHLEVINVRVADRNRPFRNLFEIEKVEGAIQAFPLLEKKLIAEHIGATGIRLDTPRTTSGKIEITDSSVSRLADKIFPSFSMSTLINSAGVDRLTEQDLTALNRQIDRINKSIPLFQDAWKSRLETLNFNESLNRIGENFNAVKETRMDTLTDMTALSEALLKLQVIEAELKGIDKQIRTQAGLFQKDYKTLSGQINGLNQAAKEDYNRIVAAITFKDTNVGDITNALFASPVINNVNQVINGIDAARKRLPVLKGGKGPSKPLRAKGVDVHFGASSKELPRFWLKQIDVSGRPAPDQFIQGTLLNLSSDPHRTGQPIVIAVHSDNMLMPFSSLSLEGSLDHRPAEPYSHLNFRLNMPFAPGVLLDNNGTQFSLAQSRLRLDGQVSLSGDTIDGYASALVLDPLFSSKGVDPAAFSLESVMARTLSRLSSFTLDVEMAGKIHQPEIQLKSTLDKALNQAVKEVAAEEMAHLKKQVDGRINAFSQGKKAQFQEQLNVVSGNVTAYLTTSEAQVKALTNQVEEKRKEAESAVAQLKKQAAALQKKTAARLKAEKARLEQEARKKAEQLLKKK